MPFTSTESSSTSTLLALLLAPTLVACAASPAVPERTTRLAGEWGGRGASLSASADAAELSFACASGHVDGAIALDARESFDVAGSYVEGVGTKPSEAIGARVPQPVRYRGIVAHDSITLTVRFSDYTSEIFTLTRGAAAQVPQCAASAAYPKERKR